MSSRRRGRRQREARIASRRNVAVAKTSAWIGNADRAGEALPLLRRELLGCPDGLQEREDIHRLLSRRPGRPLLAGLHLALLDPREDQILIRLWRDRSE